MEEFFVKKSTTKLIRLNEYKVKSRIEKLIYVFGSFQCNSKNNKRSRNDFENESYREYWRTIRRIWKGMKLELPCNEYCNFKDIMSRAEKNKNLLLT